MIILESLVVLVNLDFMNLNGNSTDLYSSVSFTLSTCDEYEKIAQVAEQYENQEVSLKASELLQRCNELSQT